jgi:predicted metal-dependent phosphoesterase TrpH
VSELVSQAAAIGLTGFSLTDHDTVAGQQEVLRLAEEQHLTAVTGLEVGATHRGYSLHILAYGFDANDVTFNNWLCRLQDGRLARNRIIMDKLQGLGLAVCQEDMEETIHQGQTGRPHIAQLLVRKQIVSNSEQAFRHYIGHNKPAWAPRFTYSAAETIDAIHQAGGLAVLAHPGQIDPGVKLQPQLVAELVERGLDGIEVYYPSHSAKIRRRLLQIAEKHKLLVTGGSDYHGKNRPGSRLANADTFCPPDTIISQLFERLNKSPAPSQ